MMAAVGCSAVEEEKKEVAVVSDMSMEVVDEWNGVVVALMCVTTAIVRKVASFPRLLCGGVACC